ncbi:MAG: PP2C family protein-serine/threonine phosphatase [Dysosmobacter welbionis]
MRPNERLGHDRHRPCPEGEPGRLRHGAARPPAARWSVVCDGMGGPRRGRVASQIAVSVYLEELEKLLTADQTPQQLLEASAQAAALANQAIQAEAERREECRNMGTTLVSAISYDGGVVVTNVGTAGLITSRRTASPASPRTTPWWKAW